VNRQLAARRRHALTQVFTVQRMKLAAGDASAATDRTAESIFRFWGSTTNAQAAFAWLWTCAMVVATKWMSDSVSVGPEGRYIPWRHSDSATG
jgi:hypothetical protein